MNNLQIKKTQDYSIFNSIKGNREIQKSHVKNLTEAFSKNKAKASTILSYNPILVNEQLEVIDGQHRLEAAKKLGIPVYYIISNGLNLKDTQNLNSNNKPWRPIDYAKAFSESGNPSYTIYLDFVEAFPRYNHDILRHVLSSGKSNGKDFKSGKFNVWLVKEAWDFLTMLGSFKEYTNAYKNRSFAMAFYRVYKLEDYNHKHMLKRMAKQGYTVPTHGNIPDFLRTLESIYNVGVEKKVRFF